MRPISFIAGAVVIAAVQSSAIAQDFFAGFAAARERGKLTHGLDIDNDTLLMNRNDGFYSSGLRYSRTYGLSGDGRLARYGWRIGQELYTASDIKLPPERISPSDHPYAAWLYLGLNKEIHQADGSALGYGVDLGCLGPCAGGEWTQKTFHRLIDQPRPRGWSQQVRDEFGVVLHGQYTPLRWPLGSTVDLAPTVHARFGNIFTDAGASLLARAGRLNQLPHQPTLHGFLRAGVNAVAWNATLQGGYFSNNDPHTVKPERVVGELELGLVWQTGEWGARLGVVRRGNEIRDLPGSEGRQNFVRLQVSYVP